MQRSGGSSFINALGRISLWFSSLLVAVLLFSLLSSLIFGGAGSIFRIFRFTMTFALPVACLYLPVLIVLRNTEEQRMPTILLGGILIGPASMPFGVLFFSGGAATYTRFGLAISRVRLCRKCFSQWLSDP
ncbi:hypothetical protein H7849_11380 [Alloacidobacterium dinghuense]|uniref:Uncharacterized protein n=1 Tax=Alloacidobacterium dinghuense TaxID=2763107 RepID=A0A7G8BPG4_9BACT|nr:hypothetical protein [Alloacidobacterium dinghuense]QNI34434.1 hypothetical protein H7849_11380 [Alloacidobacterium dinghuense]